MSPPSPGSKNKPSDEPLGSHLSLAFFFGSEDEVDIAPRRLLTFNGLHGVIYQKIKFFGTYKSPGKGLLDCMDLAYYLETILIPIYNVIWYVLK
jgi:hypothetical protein